MQSDHLPHTLTPEGPGPVPITRLADDSFTVRPPSRQLARWVERHPGAALAIAAGLGIVVGRLARMLVERAFEDR